MAMMKSKIQQKLVENKYKQLKRHESTSIRSSELVFIRKINEQLHEKLIKHFGDTFFFDTHGNEIQMTNTYKLLVSFGIQSPSMREWYNGADLQVDLTYSVGGVEIGHPNSVYNPNVNNFQSIMQCEIGENQSDNLLPILIALAFIIAVLVLVFVSGKKLYLRRK
jgi:hypothetical protein